MNNESLEKWIEDTRMQEYNNALKQIAKGYSIEEVMDSLSHRLMNKFLYLLYQDIKIKCNTSFDIELNREEYKKQYSNNRKLVADHIDDQLFDNTK